MVFSNNVKETTTTTGTGTVTLSAVSGSVRFSDAHAVNDLVPYGIMSGGDWEWGIGTVGAGNTLARTTVQATFVAGVYDTTSPTAISLSGTSTVIVTPHANAVQPAGNYLVNAANATVADLTVNGNTILGSGVEDVVVINADALTFTAQTVAYLEPAAALATGAQIMWRWTTTASGDSGGASTLIGNERNVVGSGSFGFTTIQGDRVYARHTTSGNVNNLIGSNALPFNNSAGGTTDLMDGYRTFPSVNNTGNVTTFNGYNCAGQNLSSTGRITIARGFNIDDVGHADTTICIGFRTGDLTTASSLTVGFYSLLNSATGKWGFYAGGTADNAFRGNTRFGSLVAPTATVDITGTLAVSGASTFAGAVGLGNNNLTGIKTATFSTSVVNTTTTGASTIDWSAGQSQIQNEPTGAITYTFTAPPGPCHLQLLVASDGTSAAYTHIWPANVKWMGATWAQVANKAAVINFWYDGTDYYAMGVNQV
jgi:hypothetical protein